MSPENFFAAKNLSQFVNEKRIFFLESEGKRDALEEMVDRLLELGQIEEKEFVLTRLIDREQLDSTGLGHGVAFPHARIDLEEGLLVAVGLSKEGIEFEAIDSEPVKIVFMILWEPSIPGLFNQLFAGMVKSLRDDVFRKRIIDVQKVEQLVPILSEIKLDASLEDKKLHCANFLQKLQELEKAKRTAKKKELPALAEKIALMRENLDRSILLRFDKLMARYGFAVVRMKEGVCMGCNLSQPDGLKQFIEKTNDVILCENCGKFIIC